MPFRADSVVAAHFGNFLIFSQSGWPLLDVCSVSLPTAKIIPSKGTINYPQCVLNNQQLVSNLVKGSALLPDAKPKFMASKLFDTISG